jgi:general secretion pathway protein E
MTEMGIEPGLLGSTLTCLIAQRLVRRVCPDCRETYTASAEEMAELGLPGEKGRVLARGAGCTACGGTGYRGRVGLFEVLAMSEPIRVLIAERASTSAIQRAAVEEGMRTLRQDGVRLCLEGVTTAEEVRRVAGDWN